MAIDFEKDILYDYENTLDMFFDSSSGAVIEHSRENGTPSFLFSEATGYAIINFLLLYQITNNARYIEKAQKSSEWIINSALDPDGGIKTRYYFHNEHNIELKDTSFYGRKIYSFDTAICMKGILALNAICPQKKMASAAMKIGNFLISKMVDNNGKVYPIYDANSHKNAAEDDRIWSKRFGPFHSKVADPLLELSLLTGDPVYRNSAIRICNTVLQFQENTGNFRTSSDSTELHPHCYAAEGLLSVGTRVQGADYISAARRATEWALQNSLDGEIAQVFDYHSLCAKARFRTDALAQTLALAIDLLKIGQLEVKYIGKLDEIAKKILSMKSKQHKYFEYGFYEKDCNGTSKSNTMSFWTNAFCFQALYKYCQYIEVTHNST